MSNEKFKQVEDRREDELTLEELKVLMERLHAPEPEPVDKTPDHAATVEAVCEATGESEERVWQVLRHIREEDLQTQLADRLREAEEPTYRVERPGFERDPLAALNFIRRTKEFDSALDELGKSRSKSKRKIAPTAHDRVSELIAILILFLVVTAIVLLFVLGLRQDR